MAKGVASTGNGRVHALLFAADTQHYADCDPKLTTAGPSSVLSPEQVQTAIESLAAAAATSSGAGATSSVVDLPEEWLRGWKLCG